MVYLNIAALCLCMSVITAASCDNTTQPPTVTLKEYGTLVGTTTTLQSSTATVNKYLGVPFASKPGRFERPEPPQPWESVYDATNTKPACIQTYIFSNSTRELLMSLVNGGTAPEESEDCLYLNIYAPASSNPTSNKTVMVWIYGGNLQTGSNLNPAYDGSGFAANQDVIIVTINYRVNVFGFPGAPEIDTTENNLGFYDQRLALDWVQNNIAAFGGDPQKVTIFGQSAGARSIDALVTAPPDPLPFRAAIMQSGQTTYIVDTVNATEMWSELVAAVGCSGDDELECMRTIPATTLKEAAEDHLISIGSAVQDSVTWSTTPRHSRLNSTEADPIIARVPVLIGSDTNEGSTTVLGVNSTADYLSGYGLDDTTIAALLEYYPLGTGTEEERAADVVTDLAFQCPVKFLADDSVTVEIPTWRYYYNATFPNTELFSDAGVYHGSEISLVFGTYDQSNATDFEVEVSAAIQKAWADFAKDPTNGPGWEQYPTIAMLGGGARIGEADEAREVMEMITSDDIDARCALYTAIADALP